ncbi:MAG: hypothetical protein AAF203_10095 [Pseudomonadota bacterium]
MKRKITLGLLVFFVGILITACGGDESSSVTNNNAIPLDLRDVVPECANAVNTCNRSVPARISISDRDLYLEAFGYDDTIGFSQDIRSDGFQIREGVLGLFGLADTVEDTINCAGNVLFLEWIADGLARVLDADGQEVEAECRIGGTSSRSERKELSDGTTLAGSYNADLIFYYRDNILDRVYLNIKTPTLGGTGDVLNFYPQSGRSSLISEATSFSDEGDFILDLVSSERLRLRFRDGSQIGTIRQR